MKAIYKYQIQRDSEGTIQIPKYARILCVKIQHEEICLWALVDVDSEASKITRRVQIRGTGHRLTGTEGAYIGTVVEAMGALVWHIFVSPEGEEEVGV